MEYKETLNQDRYTQRFYDEILFLIDPHKLVQRLGMNPVLFCYEKPGDFCHRHLVANWLRQAGYQVEEFKIS